MLQDMTYTWILGLIVDLSPVFLGLYLVKLWLSLVPIHGQSLGPSLAVPGCPWYCTILLHT